MKAKSDFLSLVLVFAFGCLIGVEVEAKGRAPRRIRCENQIKLPSSDNRCSLRSAIEVGHQLQRVPRVVDFDEWVLSAVPDMNAESTIVQARKIDSSTDR